MPRGKLTFGAFALLVLSMLSSARADFVAHCYDDNWSERNDGIKTGTKAYMSQCQIDTLTLPSTFDIEIGGKGSGTIVGIPSGSGDGGCTDPGGECMGWCQALCCMTYGCTNAEIYDKTDSTDDVVYTETSHSYYCKLWTQNPPPTFYSSTDLAVCTMGPYAAPNCPTLAQATLGIDLTTYNFLVYNQNNTVCVNPPSSAGAAGRKLQGLPKKVGPFWRVADIRAATRNLRVNKAALRAALKRAATRQALCLNTWKLRLQQRCPARYGGRYL